MKFLYLIMYPMTLRDWDRFGVGFMLDRGHSVTVLDLSRVIHPNFDKDRFVAVRDDRVDIHEITSWIQFKGQRQVFLDCDMVIFLIQSYGVSKFTYYPLKMIAKIGVPYLILAPTLHPGWDMKPQIPSFTNRIANIWVRLRNIDPLNSLVSRLSASWLGIDMASHIVYPNRGRRNPNTLVGPNTKIIEAHTIDYEIYLDELKRNPKPLDQAVFLDQAMSDHPDLKSSNDAPLDDEKYFRGLCRVFERIESELGLEVVIAAHPRANYDKRPGLFGDRKVITGQTAHLVATSRLVLAHQSTAIGFAVLFKKPVMILVTKALYGRAANSKYIYDAVSSELGVPLSFFDDPEMLDLSDVYALDCELYDRYKISYLACAGSPNDPFWKIVIDSINQSPTLTD